MLLVLILPLLVSACVFGRDSSVPWYDARRDSSGLAPDPATTPEAVIQVYAARIVSWRGIFAVLAVFGAMLFLAALLRLPESRSEAVALPLG